MTKILKATRSDLQEIITLQKLAYRSEAEIYDDFTIQPLIQTLDSLEEEFEMGTILKCVDNNKIIGSIRAVADHDICHIGKLIVDPAYQKRGIGSALLHAIESEFEVRLFRLFTGDKSIKNIEFYQRRGYQTVAESIIKDELKLIFMEKKCC